MIKLLLLDIDGCMTDGKIIYDANSCESKAFNVKDGLGIVSWKRLGLEVAIITGRDSHIVAHRAKELGITHLYQGIKNKFAIYEQLLEQLQLQPSEVAAIGDDLNDYQMLQHAQRSFTPNNGVDEIKQIVDTVLTRNGGDGAVREMIDILLKENGMYDQFLALWK